METRRPQRRRKKISLRHNRCTAYIFIAYIRADVHLKCLFFVQVTVYLHFIFVKADGIYHFVLLLNKQRVAHYMPNTFCIFSMNCTRLCILFVLVGE